MQTLSAWLALALAGSAAQASTTVGGDGAPGSIARAVASAGDVNGDGFDDVVVGVDGPEGGAGIGYLYLGSAKGLSTTPAALLGGEAGPAGISVAGAGDVNGDGFDDVLVGAPYAQRSAGRVSVYLGRSGGVSPTPATALTGEGVERLGVAVAGAGDVNGDGYDDVIVGAPDDRLGTRRGSARVYLGSANGLATSPVIRWIGEQPADAFGASVAGAGDVDGDGYADVLVGAPGHDSHTGRVYLYSGAAAGPGGVPAGTWSGRTPGAPIGYLVAGVGDLNGDGFGDALVAGLRVDGGLAYVLLGSSGGLRASAVIQEATHVSAVSRAGDVNWDGYGDLLVGANLWDQSRGRAGLYLGSAAGPGAEPSLVIAGGEQGDELGHAVSGAGDTDGDGFDDVIVASSGADALGGASLVEGRAQLSVTVSEVSAGEQVTVDVSGARPDDLVVVFAGTGAGERGPCLASLGGLCLGLTDGRVFGSARADAAGNVRVKATFPVAVHAGATVVFEATVSQTGAPTVAERSDRVETQVVQ